MPSIHVPSAASYIGGLLMLATSNLATFSHIHVQATSCCVLHVFGSRERKAASMQALNSGSCTSAPSSMHLDIIKDSTSASSFRRPLFWTLLTMPSKDSTTSLIHVRSLKPMTAELISNISANVVGSACEENPPPPFSPSSESWSSSLPPFPLNTLFFILWRSFSCEPCSRGDFCFGEPSEPSELPKLSTRSSAFCCFALFEPLAMAQLSFKRRRRSA
mmetsp:Transcript_159280/g.297081  ORF Transcript_159280/g.297081 Transcript_159280/m.297081 type:complete len:218 (+) Transcript_159280:2396-3049(+)